MKFVQISDLHMVPRGERLHDLNPRRRLDACIADINKHHGDAAVCIVTGDLTHNGEPDEYLAVIDALAGLSIPYHLMLGNHDDRDNFLSAFPAAETDEGGFLQSAIATPAGDFILLDTLDSREPGTDAGRYDDRRRAWLKRQLAKSGDRPVYLFMHHPPFDIGIPSLDRIRLDEPARFADTVGRYDNIRHIFLGHVHRLVTGSWRGVPFSALRGTNHNVPFDPVTITPVPKNGEPPAYSVVFLEEDRTVVHFQIVGVETTGSC